ncbi:DNA-binding transcriptional regulator [Methylovorus sp. MP688]|uniref:helix-turn-helix domain-containing protein n=1 Tax=Methylovorus sp. (strain MP688) TaxID=887061 RepID=UPI00059BA223|nr:transcriptional regulator [Methylovorus sp. MP688]
MQTQPSLSLPSPDDIKTLIKQRGLTRAEFADLLHASKRTVDKWLQPVTSDDYRQMPFAVWELALLKLDNHPVYKLAIK